MITKVKVGRLVLDYKLWPRHTTLDFKLIESMVHALEAGKELPAAVANKNDLRVIDGFHRTEAWMKFGGAELKVPVDLRFFRSEAEMFEEAMRLNSHHGRRLTLYDIASCLIKGKEMGLRIEQTADALHLTPERLTALTKPRMGTFHRKPVVLKRTLAHLAGETLSEEQAAFNEVAGGMDQVYYLNQVIGLLESDAMHLKRESVILALSKISALLDQIKDKLAVLVS